jgi:hypothetical protein
METKGAYRQTAVRLQDPSALSQERHRLRSRQSLESDVDADVFDAVAGVRQRHCARTHASAARIARVDADDAARAGGINADRQV